MFEKKNDVREIHMNKAQLIDKLNDIEWEDFEVKEASEGVPKNIWEYYFTLFNRIQQKVDLPFQKINREGFAVGEYPHLDALREALVNFLMHADYFSTMKPRIRIFMDRIEFLNPGALPKPLKMIIQEDISMPRNPVIAKVFRVAKLAENAGYGFDKMIDGWRPYADSKPEFYQGFDFTKSVFFFPGKTTVKTTGKTTGKTKDILSVLSVSPESTIPELAQELNLTEDGIRYHLKKLKEQGLLKRIGKKGGHWEVFDNN